MKYKRALTRGQIRSCEAAEHPTCRCRCAGRMHGQDHTEFASLVQGMIDEKGEITDVEINDIIDYLKYGR